jgi:Predicted acetyltransferases and hydrolases with the alpha/beta hydrolase fold
MLSKGKGIRAALGLAVMLAATEVLAADVTGVAFVHGTGKQTDALNNYWEAAIVNTVRGGLPNSANYTVVNCDFDKYMWTNEAAGCLAGQLTSFINARGITRLVVITHSNGGNVMRWILSNPTYDSRYPNIINKVRKVNALAPSSAGTPLADAVMNGNTFEQSLGWLLGYKSDAVRMQQVSWMASYNASNLYGTAVARHCPGRSARWSAPTWSPRRSTATATAVAMPPTSGWRPRRTGWPRVRMASSTAPASPPPARCGSATPPAPAMPNRSATARAAATASTSTRSCAPT